MSPVAARLTSRRGGHTGSGGGGGGGGAFAYPFQSGSVLFTPIPATPPILPSSATLLANSNWRASTYTWLGPRKRVALYYGDMSGFPDGSVYVDWPNVCATSPKYTNVPWPTGISPTWATIINSLGTDHNCNFVDTSNGDVWEGWRISGPGFSSLAASGGPPAGACDPNRWNAAIFVRFAGSAFNPAVPGGSGFAGGYTSGSRCALPNGILFPQDFDDLSLSSVIPHALTIDGAITSDGSISTYPKFVRPALAGDGRWGYGFPSGSRVQLKPSIDVNSWPSVTAKAEPWRGALRKILRTLQVYGGMVVDTNSAVGAGAINAIEGSSVRSWPGFASYLYPWEDPASNVGWSYGNGVPYDLMDPTNWQVIDWNVWTGL